MDSSAEWTADALFSPSKARAQQALAKDWAAVDAWLSKKYDSRRLPSFERNEDVLQTLITLANINETADEQRGYVERVEKSALQAMSKRHAQMENGLLNPVLSHFRDEPSVNTMAEAAVALDCPTASPMEIGKKLAELAASAFETEQPLKRTELQIAALRAEQARVNLLLKELKGEAFQVPPSLVDNTAEWGKSTKQLKAKVAEYDERLSAARPVSSSSQPFDQYLKLVKEIEDHQGQLGDFNTELQAYQDLPSNAKAARAKVEAARDQLRKVTAKREQLFEKLTDG